MVEPADQHYIENIFHDVAMDSIEAKVDDASSPFMSPFKITGKFNETIRTILDADREAILSKMGEMVDFIIQNIATTDAFGLRSPRPLHATKF